MTTLNLRSSMLHKIMPELPCDNVAAAVAHYRDVLGFTVNYAQHDIGVMDRDQVRLLLRERGDIAASARVMSTFTMRISCTRNSLPQAQK